MLHQIGPSTESGDRQTTSDHLAQHGQVGRNAVQCLCTAKSDPEAAHYFVENQHCSVPGAQASHGVQKFRCGAQQVHVAGNRLHNHARNLATDVLEHIFELLWIVVVEDQRVLGKILGDTSRGRVAERQQATACLYKQ